MELFQKKTVNTRLESKLIVAKCRKSVIFIQNTSYNIFQKNLEIVSTFVGIGYIPRSVNKRVHITEKTALMTKSIFSLFTYLQFIFCFENWKLTAIWRNFQVNCTISTRILDLDDLLNIWAYQFFTFPIFMIHFDLN